MHFEKYKDLHNVAEVFKNDNEDADIFEAAAACILALQSAPTKMKDLNTLRYHSFLKGTVKYTGI